MPFIPSAKGNEIADCSFRLALTDEQGQQMIPRLERVLLSLVAKLQRHFPSIRDEVTVVEILEEAGRKIIRRENRAGAIERLHGYAWVAVRSVATSHLRRGVGRLELRVLTSNEAEDAIDFTPAEYGGQDDIERGILLRELLGRLRPADRAIWHWRIEGLSSLEMAERRGGTVAAAEKALSRALARLRSLVAEDRSPLSEARPSGHQDRRLARLCCATSKRQPARMPCRNGSSPCRRRTREGLALCRAVRFERRMAFDQ